MIHRLLEERHLHLSCFLPVYYLLRLMCIRVRTMHQSINYEYVLFQTFHTPSFGDENFDIPLNMPTVSQPCYSQPQTYVNRPPQNAHQFAHPQQPVSLTNFHFTQPSSQNLHSTGHAFGLQNNGQPHRLKHENEAFPEPQFPPQNFEIPDIQVSNSVLYPSEKLGGVPLEIQQHTHTFQKPLPQNILQTLGGFVPPSTQAQVKGQGGKVASPPGSGSTNTSPSRDSVSEDSSSEDSLPLAQVRHSSNNIDMM